MTASHWLTVRQASEQLGFTEDTIREWCAQGIFPNAGKSTSSPRAHWRIPESDIQQFGKHRAEHRATTLDHTRRKQLMASRRAA